VFFYESRIGEGGKNVNDGEAFISCDRSSNACNWMAGYGFDDSARTDSLEILPELSTISSSNWTRSAEDR
jgi:hypothetical protein